MKPRGPLMIEHRLIERMLKIVQVKIAAMRESGKADPVFIDTVVDFVRTYADRTHHGKEEDILFKLLAEKPMSETDRAIMRELLDEHVFGRNIVKALVAAKDDYLAGNGEAVAVIVQQLETLAKFYPEHIKKEDKVFFPSTEKLFSQEELDRLLRDFFEFDQRMIHEKYESVVAGLKE